MRRQLQLIPGIKPLAIFTNSSSPFFASRTNSNPSFTSDSSSPSIASNRNAKLLSLSDSGIALSTGQHCKKYDKRASKAKADKTKAFSKMKELLRWVASAKPEMRGKCINPKVLHFRNKAPLKALPVDELSNESPKISFRWDVENCSNMSSSVSVSSSAMNAEQTTGRYFAAHWRLPCRSTQNPIILSPVKVPSYRFIGFATVKVDRRRVVAGGGGDGLWRLIRRGKGRIEVVTRVVTRGRIEVVTRDGSNGCGRKYTYC